MAKRHFGDKLADDLILFPFASSQMEQREEGLKKEINVASCILPLLVLQCYP